MTRDPIAVVPHTMVGTRSDPATRRPRARADGGRPEIVTSPAFVPFEHAFPSTFADAVKALLDGAGLDEVLRRTCSSVSEQIAPRALGLVRIGDDGGHITVVAVDGPVCAERDVGRPGRPRWGVVRLSAPDLDDTGTPELDAVAGFMTWIVDRHDSRRRRIATIDRERQVIAGQLHDDSVQAMTAVALRLQGLARAPGVDREQVDLLLHITNDAIERLRHMMFALHPPALATDGLVVTLEDYLEGFIAPLGMRTTVHGDETARGTPEVEALAFRLARAAIHNSWKHARATRLDVWVDLSPTGVAVTVRDDGVGFDPSPAAELGHAGIEYSRDLATEAGGTYELRSAPGAGTTVTFTLPSR